MSNMGKKILILTGGSKKKLDAFIPPAENLGINVTLASFYDLEFTQKTFKGKLGLTIQGKDISEFQLIYIRMVGKRMEDATLLLNCAHDLGIRVIDKAYEKGLFIPSTISKAMEMKKLIEEGIPMPDTYFGNLFMIRDKIPALFGFPFIIKSTSGKKARDVWKVDDTDQLEFLITELRERENRGDRFFAQKLIPASQRIRVLVVGGKVLGAITRPTKWRKSFIDKQDGVFPEGKKEALIPVPIKYSDLAVKSVNAVDLDISGVDILEEDRSEKLYVIEANAAPSWKLIAKDCEVDVEEEILKYLASLC